jgi:hypothetical protein
MEFFKKLLPLIIIAIVFAVGGYFIGRGALSSQEASFYKATTKAQQVGGVKASTTGPTDPSCPDGTCTNPVRVNNTCAEGYQFIAGKCVAMEFFTKASVETSAKVKMTSEEWAAWCKSRGLVLNADGSCSRPITVNTGSSVKN